MRIMILGLFLLASNVFANVEVKEEFYKFYNSDQIKFNLCGQNIQEFLQHLKKKNIAYDSAKVFSLHEDYGALNHFDGRWGRTEEYENGEEYSRSNWYFHVFAVIDGDAYDFSMAGNKVMPFDEYVDHAYLPKFTTQNIMLQGKISRKKVLKESKKIKMNVIEGDKYLKNASFDAAHFSGRFSDLLSKLIGDDPTYIRLPAKTFRSSAEQGSSSYMIKGKMIEKLLKAERQVRINEDTTEFTKPYVLIEDEKFYLSYHYGTYIFCRAMGYRGVVQNSVKLSKTEGEKYKGMTYLTDYNPNFNELSSTKSLTLSFWNRVNVTRYRGINNLKSFQYVRKIRCVRDF